MRNFDIIPSKNKYKFKKHWEKIFANMIIPKNIPTSLTKNIVLLGDGKEIKIKNTKMLEKTIEKLTQNNQEIGDCLVEVNFQKIISVVEKKYSNLFKK